MIETGIARQLDAVGRITLPKELRKSLGFKDRELLKNAILSRSMLKMTKLF